MYSKPFCCPRFSSSNARIPPRCSSGVRIVARMAGSSIFTSRPGSGIFAGESISVTLPSVVVTIPHARRRGDQIEIEFAFQTFLHNLHVQQAEKAATKSKTKRG